jgi:hypothetical protein
MDLLMGVACAEGVRLVLVSPNDFFPRTRFMCRVTKAGAIAANWSLEQRGTGSRRARHSSSLGS